MIGLQKVWIAYLGIGNVVFMWSKDVIAVTGFDGEIFTFLAPGVFVERGILHL